jgi:hypothetical protein
MSTLDAQIYFPSVVTQSKSGFGGLEDEGWPLVPKFAGPNPAENIPITPFFGGEVKPALPCRRFTACKKIPKCYTEVGI